MGVSIACKIRLIDEIFNHCCLRLLANWRGLRVCRAERILVEVKCVPAVRIYVAAIWPGGFGFGRHEVVRRRCAPLVRVVEGHDAVRERVDHLISSRAAVRAGLCLAECVAVHRHARRSARADDARRGGRDGGRGRGLVAGVGCRREGGQRGGCPRRQPSGPVGRRSGRCISRAHRGRATGCERRFVGSRRQRRWQSCRACRGGSRGCVGRPLRWRRRGLGGRRRGGLQSGVNRWASRGSTRRSRRRRL